MIYWEGDLPFLMISSETPYKLSEIIRDTWPGIYRTPKISYNEKKHLKPNNKNTENV